MSVAPTTSLSFDASCLFAAAASRSGGAAFLIDLCEADLLTGWTSDSVLGETERNLTSKLPGPAWPRLETRIAHGALHIAVPVLSARSQVRGINHKDAHVYAHALVTGVDYILTLDRPLRAEITAIAGGPIAAMPGEFIQQFLPSHPKFPDLRRLLGRE